MFSPHTKACRPWLFLLLVILFSAPFYFLNLINFPTPLDLPPSFLMIIVPFTVALGMSYREGGSASIRRLFTPFAVLRGTSAGGWLAFSIVAVPALVLLMYLLSVLFYPDKLGAATRPPLSFPIIFGLYFVGAIPEEVGWTMYATKPLQERHDVFRSGFIIGVVWGLWHVIPFVWQGRSWWWIAAQVVFVIALRIIMGYAFAHTRGSLLPALILHTSINAYPEILPGGMDSYRPAILMFLGWMMVAILGALNTAHQRLD